MLMLVVPEAKYIAYCSIGSQSGVGSCNATVEYQMELGIRKAIRSIMPPLSCITKLLLDVLMLLILPFYSAATRISYLDPYTIG